MAEAASSRGARNASRYLVELLRGTYRPRWNRPTYVARARADQVHHGAVANVLAEYLWNHPREGHPEDRDVLPNQLTPLVSRALGGQRLSQQTLGLFIQAFGMRDGEAYSLRQQWEGRAGASVITGDLTPPRELLNYRPPDYEKVKLSELHRLGPDGLPARHRTSITIRSRVDGLATYPYRIDTPHAQVRVTQGGEAGELHQVGEGIWVADITLPWGLRHGEDHSIEFWTILKYDEPPPREMRRATHERITNLDVRVQFDPARLPSAVWWAEWGHYQGPDNRITDRELCPLNKERAVYRYVETVQQAVVGFCWDW